MKGRADLLALDPVSGAAEAWINGGSGGSGGEAFSWSSQGTVFPGGYMRGECIHFAKWVLEHSIHTSGTLIDF
jgi:hypothetical protein